MGSSESFKLFQHVGPGLKHHHWNSNQNQNQTSDIVRIQRLGGSKGRAGGGGGGGTYSACIVHPFYIHNSRQLTIALSKMDTLFVQNWDALCPKLTNALFKNSEMLDQGLVQNGQSLCPKCPAPCQFWARVCPFWTQCLWILDKKYVHLGQDVCPFGTTGSLILDKRGLMILDKNFGQEILDKWAVHFGQGVCPFWTRALSVQVPSSRTKLCECSCGATWPRCRVTSGQASHQHNHLQLHATTTLCDDHCSVMRRFCCATFSHGLAESRFAPFWVIAQHFLLRLTFKKSPQISKRAPREQQAHHHLIMF